MHNLHIRPLQEKDAAISFRWRNDPDIWRYTASRPDREITHEIEKEWIQKVVAEPTAKRFAIIADDVYVGNVYLTDIKNGVGEYHIFIGDKNFWGRGVAKEASRQIIEYGENELGLHKITLGVHEANAAARKLYEKLGFMSVGRKDGFEAMELTLPLPLVSILCTTYNHAKFITQTLDGFLMQKTTFSFEVMVHDDASTDTTQRIIRRYQKKHPSIIRPIYQTENQYVKGEFAFINDMFRSARGKYVAFCEGDDFWTDPAKLQLQVDFLESHADYGLHFHPVKVFYEAGEQGDFIYPELPENFDFSVEELLRWNYIQTNSVLWRAQNYDHLPTGILPSDWYLHLYHAKFGKIGFTGKVMAAYRRQSGGVWYDTHNNIDRIWLKHGLKHLKLYDEMGKLYGDKEQNRDIIYAHIDILLTTFTAVDAKYHASLFDTAKAVFPELVAGYLLRRQQTARSPHPAAKALRQIRRIRNVPRRIKRYLRRD